MAIFAAPASHAVEIPGGKSILLSGKKAQGSMQSFSLLDPERFTMKNQYVMSYSSNNMSGNNLMGMYINTMEYRFKCPLIMRVKTAYQTQTGHLFGSKGIDSKLGLDQGRVYVPAVDLIYQPTKNTTISFHYRDYSSSYGYNGMSGYGFSPYSRYRSRRYSPFYGW